MPNKPLQGRVRRSRPPDRDQGQPARRRGVMLTDQHGRRWEAVIELATGHFVGEPSPRFKAPVVPPRRFLVPDPQNPNGVVIRYDAWLATVEKAREDWENSLREHAQKIGAQGTIQDLIEDPPPELVDLVGPKPDTHSRRLIESMWAGNPYLIHGEGSFAGKLEEHVPADRKRRGVPRWRPSRTDVGGLTTNTPSDPFAGGGGGDVAREGESAVQPPEEYELFMRAPGRWPMPDGSDFLGTREEAMANLEQEFPHHHDQLE